MLSKTNGHVFARLTKERRRKALMGIHKDLAHMADEEFKASDVLFGEDVVKRVKKRHDALKTLRAVKQPFQKGGAQKRNRFGRREKHRLLPTRPVQRRQFQESKVSFPTKRPSKSLQERVSSPLPKRQKLGSAPPSEGAGNIKGHSIMLNHQPSPPSWLKATR